MELTIAHFEVRNITVTKEIDFPLYRWWDNRKERIIKMYPVYYEHDPKLMRHVVIINIHVGWNTDARMIKEHVLAHNNIIEEKIQQYFLDYDVKATEQEFLELKRQALEELQ